MTLELVNKLTDRFAEVDLRISDPSVSLAEGVVAHLWVSPYAHVYLADVPVMKKLDWKSILADVDSRVLAHLRREEIKSGGVIDAHVCFIVDDDARKELESQIDEIKLRHVARKYWLDRKRAFEDVLSRLTLLTTDALPHVGGRTDMGLTASEESWVERIVKEGPASSFQAFVTKEKCEL